MATTDQSATDAEFARQKLQHHPPRRRILLEVAIHADDRVALVRALEEILESLERGTPGGVSGGCSVGYRFKVSEDTNITPQTYQEALGNYLAILNAEAGHRPN